MKLEKFPDEEEIEESDCDRESREFLYSLLNMNTEQEIAKLKIVQERVERKFTDEDFKRLQEHLHAKIMNIDDAFEKRFEEMPILKEHLETMKQRNTLRALTHGRRMFFGLRPVCKDDDLEKIRLDEIYTTMAEIIARKDGLMNNFGQFKKEIFHLEYDGLLISSKLSDASLMYIEDTFTKYHKEFNKLFEL